MKNKNTRSKIKTVFIIFDLVIILLTALIIKVCIGLAGEKEIQNTVPTENLITLDITVPISEEPSTEETIPPEEFVPITATIGSMGDLLMHKPIFDDLTQYNAAVQLPDGSYDFSSIFQYLSPYTNAADYAVANLETTLAGGDNGYPYDGYPHFNCPDSLIDSLKDAGFDMLLTANNHSYDTGMVGYKRTVEVVQEKGLATLGTYRSPTEQKWSIQEINGINVGMLCYTWAFSVPKAGQPSLNGNAPLSEADLCNYFYEKNLDPFYAEVTQYINDMNGAGAEALVMYIHWGTEYALVPNDVQRSIAQKLCDMGIDVIIGGHPHVIQPVELLQSTTDPEHKTVCLYSTGNAISNQRFGSLSRVKTAHTEDGVLFLVTFEKDADGAVYLSDVSALPTWVRKFRNSNGKDEYNILPLDHEKSDEWQMLYGLDDATLDAAKASYARTMELVGEGLTEAQDWIHSGEYAKD